MIMMVNTNTLEEKKNKIPKLLDKILHNLVSTIKIFFIVEIKFNLRLALEHFKFRYYFKMEAKS